MMESRNEAQDFVGCDLCQQPVSFFCRRCGVNLCDPCVTIHLRVKSTNVHEIVDFASKDDDDTCHCDSHPQNDCSAYCKTCDAPICILCVSIKHKSHEMSELSDKIEELLKVIAKENDRLQSSKHELEKILDHTTKMLSSISLYYKQRKNEVTARGEEWHKLIEKTVKKLHQELDDMQKEHEAVLQKQKKEFEEMIGKVDEMNGKTVKLKKSKNVKEMQTFVPAIQNHQNLNEVSQYSFPSFYKCKIDPNYLQTYFGYVEKMQEKKTLLLEDEFKERELPGRRILEVPTVTSVIDTGFPADRKKNRLYDMAVTDDNKVWMGGASFELRLFDLQEIQYDSQCQPLYIWAVYITENVNGDIIVTDWEKDAVIAVDRLGIFRYSYSGKDSEFFACSVVTDSVGHVIVTGGFGKKISMLDRDGRFLRYIIPEGGIKDPRAVCILGDGEMMVGEMKTGIAKKFKYLEE
uniref:B box-type domain-containing protein n=1 Tax=Magallana gigas TaxID=29159 RepID=A0A8W8I2G9_MAGGI